MNTATGKMSLFDLLLRKLRLKGDPLKEHFERENHRAAEWMGQAFNVMVIVIFSFILVVCTLAIGVAMLAGYGTVALGVIIGFEVLLAFSGILLFTIVVPSRNNELERLHDHLDLVSAQIKSADSRVDGVVTVDRPSLSDEDLIEFAAQAAKSETEERLRAIRASYAAAVDVLDARLAHD